MASPPPPLPVRCAWLPVPGTGVCRLPDVWKREATTLCSTKSRRSGDLKLDKACAMGGFTDAQAECCDTTIPGTDAAASTCVGAVLGDGMTCSTEANLKAEADKTCSARGMKLDGFAATIRAAPCRCSVTQSSPAASNSQLVRSAPPRYRRPGTGLLSFSVGAELTRLSIFAVLLPRDNQIC